MRTTLAVCFMIFLVLPLAAGDTEPVDNFAELMDCLKNGEHVEVVIHYGQCKLMIDGEEHESPAAIGGMSIEVWEYFPPMLFGNPNGFLSFSESKLIQNPLGEGHVYNYVKMRMIDTGEVQITAQYLKPDTLEPVMDELFVGTIHSDDAPGAIHLFKQDD